MAFKRVFKGFKEETTSETEQLDFSLWIYIIKLPPKPTCLLNSGANNPKTKNLTPSPSAPRTLLLAGNYIYVDIICQDITSHSVFKAFVPSELCWLWTWAFITADIVTWHIIGNRKSTGVANNSRVVAFYCTCVRSSCDGVPAWTIAAPWNWTSSMFCSRHIVSYFHLCALSAAKCPFCEITDGRGCFTTWLILWQNQTLKDKLTQKCKFSHYLL